MLKVLGIESSCDETGIALVGYENGHPVLLGQTLHSQIELHARYGGVVPELASREHITRVVPLLQELLRTTSVSLSAIDAIAYTQGPGLAGALLVGAGFACALAATLEKPTMGIHHLEGHLLSPFLGDDPPAFPFLCLLVSGGHTQIMRVNGVGNYQLLGETIDDAAGEAFDKSAQLLGLAYPGGAALSRLAEGGNPRRLQLPRPLIHEPHFDFSFSGLKTAVRVAIERNPIQTETDRADFAASIETAIVEVLIHKVQCALEATELKRLVVAGGVGANRSLRAKLNTWCQTHGVQTHYPPLALCTDNGAMIALAGAMRLAMGVQAAMPNYSFEVKPRWDLTA